MYKELELLQQRVLTFGQKLSPELCKEFRDILDHFTKLHYSFGEAYKMACIDLIPSKIQQTNCQQIDYKENVVLPPVVFEPPKKKDLTSIALALAKNLEMNLKKE